MIDLSRLPTNPNEPVTPMCLDVARMIWDLKLQGHKQSRIAAALDVNPGRVAEVLTGQRYPEARPDFV